MKKNLRNSILKAVLLPLFLLCMIVSAASAIVADTGEAVFTLTLTFKSDEVEKCLVTVTKDSVTTEHTLTVAENSIEIKRNSEVTVQIIPKTGKEASRLTVSVGDPLDANKLEKNTIKWTNFLGSFTAEIGCSDRKYDIVMWDYNRTDDGISYSPETDADTELFTNLKKESNPQYQAGGASPILLPNVKIEGKNFVEWRILTGAGERDYIVADTVLCDDGVTRYCLGNALKHAYFDEVGQIRIYPHMTPKSYPIYREDWLYDPNQSDKLGTDYFGLEYNHWQLAEHGSTYSADPGMMLWGDEKDSGAYKKYLGYEMLADPAYPVQTVGPTVGTEDRANTAKRYYMTVTYTLTFWDDDGSSLRENMDYPYRKETVIANPTRDGYTFLGWTVEVYRGGEWKAVEGGAYQKDLILGKTGNSVSADSVYASEKNETPEAEYAYEIRLRANWEANDYDIVYDWGLPADASEELKNWMQSNATNLLLPTDFAVYTFDTALSVPSPIRPGYSFAGWILSYGDRDTDIWTDVYGVLTLEEGLTALPTGTYPNDLKLTATWTAENYTVLLDPVGGASGEKTELTVTYDAYLSILQEDIAKLIPAFPGYTFEGFYSEAGGKGICYIDKDGNPVNTKWKTDDGDGNPGTVTLYAHWVAVPYSIEIKLEPVEGLEITVSPEGMEAFPYTGPFQLDYGTKFTITFKSPAGYKVAYFDGVSSPDIADVPEYTTPELTVGVWTEGKTFTVKILPVRTLENIGIDYRNELLINLASGSYTVTWEGNTAPIPMTVIGSTMPIADEWFGKNLTIVYCGNGSTSSDSAPVTLTLAARPEVPKWSTPNDKQQIHSISPYDYFIEIIMESDLTVPYEFAIRESGLTTALVWTATPKFTELKPGTSYEIHIRAAATDDAPHGSVTVVCDKPHTTTTTVDYMKDVMDQLDQMLGDNPGDVTQELIDQAKEEIGGWAVDPDRFYEKVEAYLEELREKELAIAIEKDRAIRELTDFLEECLATGHFTATDGELKTICAAAIAEIKALTNCTPADIENVRNKALNDMKAVEIHTLTETDKNVTVTVESVKGLYQDSRLTLIGETDFATLLKKIDDAIRTSGKVSVDGFMTVAEAEQILRGLDVFASYRFEMSHSDKIKSGDRFTVRLLISDELRGKTGLQVAYYDEETGVIELLKTDVSEDGKYLIFETTRIADFVILGDPTLDFLPIIISLGAILFCQIIAIAVLLISRSGSKKRIKHASVLFPTVALTVHFSPVGGELIALVMACAVVVLQIVLMVLLFSSGMIHLPKRRRQETEETDIPVSAASYDPYSGQDAYAVPEESFDDEAALYADAEGESEEAYADPAEDGEENDPFAVYGMGDDSEDFIEPAATTRYSLPDDEFSLYADEEDVEDIDLAEDPDDAPESEEAFAYADEEAFYEDAEELFADDEADADAYDAGAYVEDAYFAPDDETGSADALDIFETETDSDSQAFEEEALSPESYENSEEYDAEEYDDANAADSEDDLYRYDE